MMFRLPIGDWSEDGHRVCEWFTVESEAYVDDWREAYFKAAKKWPRLVPTLEDPPTTAWKAAVERTIGFRFEDDLDPEEWARYTLAFCQKADPSLTGTLVSPTMFPFYGYDAQGRHIGQIGYHLFEDL